MAKIKFPAVGKCIYCGATEYTAESGRPLHLEHIVPESLWGTLELPEASCKRCEDITHRFEFTCARQIFGPLRMKFNAPTKRPRERPATVEIETNSRGAKSVRTSEFPTLLFLYKLMPPNILLGLPSTANTLQFVPISIFDKAEMDDFKAKHDWNTEQKVKMNVVPFGRLLAKIAHGIAIARFGINSFKPLALDVVLGRTENISHVVGGEWDIPPRENYLHRIQFAYEQVPGRIRLMVRIRLFAFMESPEYCVIVGESHDGEQIIRLRRALSDDRNIEISVPFG